MRLLSPTWTMPTATILTTVLPDELVWFAARVGAWFSWRLDRGRRAAVEKNLRLLGIDGPGCVWRTFRNSAYCLVDLLRVPTLSRRQIAVRGQGTGLGHLQAAVASGRGVILVTAHLGNYELGGIYLAANGIPMHAVVEAIGGGVTDAYERYRRCTGVETIPLDEPVRMRRALRQREVLALLADRDLSGTGAVFAFGDGRRALPLGLARLACRTGALLVPAYFMLRDRPGLPYHVVIEPPLECPHTGHLESDILAAAHTIADHILSMIRRFPDQWFVFQDEWQ